VDERHEQSVSNTVTHAAWVSGEAGRSQFEGTTRQSNPFKLADDISPQFVLLLCAKPRYGGRGIRTPKSFRTPVFKFENSSCTAFQRVALSCVKPRHHASVFASVPSAFARCCGLIGPSDGPPSPCRWRPWGRCGQARCE
jgi:hypothetical protein